MECVGETGRQLKERVNEHLRDIRLNRIIKTVAVHFNSTRHSIYKVQVLVLEKVHGQSKALITKTRLFKYIQNFSHPFQIKKNKNIDIFQISAQNIDCGYSLEPPRRGGSNEFPQSMFPSKNKKIMYTPVNPSFTIQKWGLRGSKLYRHVFVMTSNPGK